MTGENGWRTKGIYDTYLPSVFPALWIRANMADQEDSLPWQGLGSGQTTGAVGAGFDGLVS